MRSVPNQTLSVARFDGEQHTTPGFLEHTGRGDHFAAKRGRRKVAHVDLGTDTDPSLVAGEVVYDPFSRAS